MQAPNLHTPQKLKDLLWEKKFPFTSFSHCTLYRVYQNEKAFSAHEEPFYIEFFFERVAPIGCNSFFVSVLKIGRPPRRSVNKLSCTNTHHKICSYFLKLHMFAGFFKKVHALQKENNEWSRTWSWRATLSSWSTRWARWNLFYISTESERFKHSWPTHLR